ncbi:MAG: hypothetical protein C5B48_15120 [Candidatus Rokuibacteriota bacterium]|nr:MAG: hypothetical protein C5B48_15120 [Candidatus Rokubacteria bacterium]
MTCPSCGAENPAGKRFCGDCGAALVLVCPSCGSPSPPGKRFCGDCGATIDDAPAAGKAPAAPAAPVAERRLVSVLFADLVGFTTASEERDAEETRELLSRYFELARRLIARYGGTVEKFIGDAVMAVWGTPLATESDAERSVRAALDLVASIPDLDPALRARAGVLTGEAAVTLGAEGEGMVAGDLVNTASRVQSVAEPGTVLVGETTRRASERAVAYESAGEHELKGKSEPVALWRALRVVSGVGGALKSTGLEAPFVGRERELKLIKELFHACAHDRRAHLVSVTGIAGIGKSRLAWEFYKYFDGIVDQVWWHRGRCLAYGEGIAYWALADMIRMRCRIGEEEEAVSAREKLAATLHEQVLDAEERSFIEPRLAHLLGLEERSGFERQDLFAAWRLFFERLADSNPVVLAFEDMQWADTSLLDFVEYLLDWSRDTPLYVITLARPELQERRPGWGAGQRNFSSLYLEPLSEEAMEELLDGLVPGLPEKLRDQILARAEGVPLYAVETVRMLLDRGLLAEEGPVYRPTGEIETLDVPETLHALIAARLDGLSIEERKLLQDAAVLGKTFTRNALGALSGLPEPELEPLLISLVRKEVLGLQSDPRSPEQGQYGFLQDLVRHVAYETLSKRERKGRHLAAAAHLEGAFAGEDEVAEVIASHLLAAYEVAPGAEDADDLKARAARTLVRAGERAAGLAAAAEAQRYFEQAAELTSDQRTRAELADRAGQMAWIAGRPTQARVLFDRARAGYEERGNAVAAARADARLADLDFAEGHPPRAVERLVPALETLEAGGSDEDVAVLAAQLGRFLIFTGDHAVAVPHLERALSLAEELGLTETFVEALNSKSVLMVRQHRRRESRILVRGALAVALEHDLHTAALRAYNNLSANLWFADEWREQVSTIERSLELARRVGHRLWEATFLAGSIGVLAVLGRWDEALARAVEAEELAPAEFQRALLLYAVPIHCYRGAIEPARELLERYADVGGSENLDLSSGYAVFEALVLGAEGRSEEASKKVEVVLRSHLESVGHPAWLLFNCFEAVASSEQPDAIRALQAAVDGLGVGRPPALRAQEARFRARLPEHDAESELAAAEDAFRRLEAQFHVAATQLEHAEWLIGQGRMDEARPLLAEARKIFEQLRAKPWLERLAAVESAGLTEEVPA